MFFAPIPQEHASYFCLAQKASDQSYISRENIILSW